MMTVFIPLPVSQAVEFLRNPWFGISRARDASFNLVGFHCAKQALEAARLAEKGDIAIVHIEFGETFHEGLCRAGLINGTGRHPGTGAALWTIKPQGSNELCAHASFRMQIVRGEAGAARDRALRELGDDPAGWIGCKL